MKTKILLSGFALLCISAITNNEFTTHKTETVTVNKKVQQAFAYFRVHRMANDASLNWGHTNPLAAVHFKIERSYDGSWFETIADMEATASAAYKYRDNTVFPGTIYYRVTAYHHDGSSEQSPVESLRIVKRH